MSVSRPMFSSVLGRNFWDNWECPTGIFDQHLGTSLCDRDLYTPVLYRGNSLRPRYKESVKSSSVSEIKNDKDAFQVMLNVKQFKPDEIEVKVLDDFVVIHGKHQERNDEHGFIEREFTRRYMLPEGAELEKVKSSLSANGVLTIDAPKKTVEEPKSNERVIPITMSTEDSEKKTSS